jgi:tRNA nucleotidyltransferase (CCA-adding enzyme)
VSLTIRVTGGWVRDKLLGISSHDIDVAVDKCSGEEFAMLFKDVPEVSGIITNPEQSEHLHTAKMQVLGIEIDCNRLRAETYTKDSRIPEIVPGSPEQDAFRRDFTVNALFYNLGLEQVEDFTGKGLEDLEKKTLRTCKDAKESFEEDPLRILRAVRFASRLGFACDEDLVAQAQYCAHLISTKVSSERVGMELMGMLECKDPSQVANGVSLMVKFGLFPHIFTFPRDSETKREDCPWNEKALEEVVKVCNKLSGFTHKNIDGIPCPEAWLCAMLWRFNANSYVVSSKNGKSEPLLSHFVRHCIKCPTSSCTSALTIQESCRRIAQAVEHVHSDSEIIRELEKSIVAVAEALHNASSSWKDVVRLLDSLSVMNGDLLMMWIEDRGLGGIWEWKPPLNGKQVMSTFNVKGPAVGTLMKKQFEWRVYHPGQTTEHCIAFIKEYLEKKS